MEKRRKWEINIELFGCFDIKSIYIKKIIVVTAFAGRRQFFRQEQLNGTVISYRF